MTKQGLERQVKSNYTNEGTKVFGYGNILKSSHQIMWKV